MNMFKRIRSLGSGVRLFFGDIKLLLIAGIKQYTCVILVFLDPVEDRRLSHIVLNIRISWHIHPNRNESGLF